MSRLSRTVLALVLGAALAAPAFASEAGDAYKEATAKKDAVRKAGKDEAKRQEAEAEFTAFAKGKAEALAPQKAGMTRVDLMYLGWLQFWGGDKQAGIATVREAVTSKAETKYATAIHANLVKMLIDAGEPDGAGVEADKMKELYPEAKETKAVILDVGLAHRGALNFEKAAKWLRDAWAIGNTDATKPLVTSLVMMGKKDEAVAAAKEAVEKGIPQKKEDMQVLADVTEKIGTDVSGLLAFDAFVPAGDVEIKGKVVVLGFWNVSSRTFRMTLNLLDSIKKEYGDDVTPLAATTYYKKNPESGKIEEDMTPDAERGWGSKLVFDQEGWRGRIAYLKDEATQKALGLTGLPHYVVVGKDGTLLWAFAMNYPEADVKILRKILDQATGR